MVCRGRVCPRPSPKGRGESAGYEGLTPCYPEFPSLVVMALGRRSGERNYCKAVFRGAGTRGEGHSPLRVGGEVAENAVDRFDFGGLLDGGGGFGGGEAGAGELCQE